MKKFYFILSLLILSTNVFSQFNLSSYGHDIGDVLETTEIYSNNYLYTNEVEYDYNGAHCKIYKQKCSIEYHNVSDEYGMIVPQEQMFDTIYTPFGDKELLKSVDIPKLIYNEYKYGCSLTKAGTITISIGSVLCLSGFISYGIAGKFNNINALKAGNVLVGVGGSIVSVSIPLLSCGSFHKWHANHDFNLHFL